MITTDNGEIETKIRLLRNHGRITKKYEHEIEGYSSRLDNLQAAILRVKLRYLNYWNDMRRFKAKRYNDLLIHNHNIITPYEADYSRHMYHLYVVKVVVEERGKLIEKLDSQGISTGIHYPIPLHLQPAYKHLGHKIGDFPITEECSKKILSLPMFPELTDKQIEEVVEYL